LLFNTSFKVRAILGFIFLTFGIVMEELTTTMKSILVVMLIADNTGHKVDAQTNNENYNNMNIIK